MPEEVSKSERILAVVGMGGSAKRTIASMLMQEKKHKCNCTCDCGGSCKCGNPKEDNYNLRDYEHRNK